MYKKIIILKFNVLFILLFGFLFSFLQAQTLSSQAKVSVITIGPGESLNDIWGHSAIRIQDAKKGFDIVYNYGVYDFNTPNFYTKFMQGKLLYDLGVGHFYSFFKHYTSQNREVKEQVLNLSQEQKQAYFDFLQNNAKPENKKYLYEFFFDNCATKLRDVTSEVLKESVNFNDELFKQNLTFRDLIYQKLESQPWGKFGIDIALGSVIDRRATPKEFTFLPSYIFKSFGQAQVFKNGKTIPLVKETNILVKSKDVVDNRFTLSPMLVFSILALFIIIMTYFDFKNKKQTKIIDFVLLITTGLIGLLIVVLWFATDHSATKNNFNILWAFLPNLFFAFYVFKKNKQAFLNKYYIFLLVLIMAQIFIWIFKIQIFNYALIPVLLILVLRYLYNRYYILQVLQKK